MASTQVYEVLLHQPQWYGVPLKTVMWNFMAMMGFILLILFLVPPILLKILGSLVVVLITVAIHITISRSGKTDPDLMEIVFRFALLPRYLGPR